MTDIAQAKRTLLRTSDRVGEIVETFVKYGYSSWVVGVPDQYRSLLSGLSQPELLELSDGERLSRACLELGVTFIKIGQVLSTRSDIVGPEIAAAMTDLQGDVPPDPPEVVRATIREQLGDDIDNLVEDFDDTPLGSASVAQVHAATLHDGTEVEARDAGALTTVTETASRALADRFGEGAIHGTIRAHVVIGVA